MRKWYILAAALLCVGGVFSVSAQDMIILKNGNVVEAKVTEITPTEIKYKRIDNLNGPTIVVRASEVLSIRYENGTVENISSAAPAASSVAEVPADYRNFTGGQRFGTFALNQFAVPGLGSFIFMRDKKGGGILMGTGLGAYSLVITGSVLMSNATRTRSVYNSGSYSGGSYSSGYTTYETRTRKGPLISGIILLGFGGSLYVFNTVFNIVRSASYRKPIPRAGSIVDPSAWDLALVPGESGLEQVALAYTFRF